MQETPKRGALLGAFLILVLLANLFAGISYLCYGPAIKQQLPFLPAWAFPVIIIFSFINCALMVAVWYWIKWGVLGFGAVVIAIFFINLSIGLPLYISSAGLLGLAILLILVLPKRHYFR